MNETIKVGNAWLKAELEAEVARRRRFERAFGVTALFAGAAAPLLVVLLALL